MEAVQHHALMQRLFTKVLDAPEAKCFLAYLMTAALVARKLGANLQTVAHQHPKRRATRSPTWMRAAEARRLAVYLLVVECNFSLPEVARAAGMTRQAVHQACHAIEEKREESRFDRMLDELTAAVMGEW